jgi:hypothetical protein
MRKQRTIQALMATMTASSHWRVKMSTWLVTHMNNRLFSGRRQ